MSVKRPRVAGVVLAAGEATRMGEPKVTLPYGDSTIVESVVSVALESGLDPIMVVTGFYHEAVTAVVGEGVRVVHNPDASTGNLSSLRVGVGVIGDVDAVVLLLGDMPGVDPEVVQQLAHEVVSTGALGGLVQYTGDQTDRQELGHPIVLSRRGLERVLSLTGEKSVWRYLRSLHRDEVVTLETDAPMPIDVNTPDDYRRLLAGEV